MSEIEQLLEAKKNELRRLGRGKALRALYIPETPYKWQLDAVRVFNDSLARGTVVAPTATGKTLVAILLMRDYATPTMVITPTDAVLRRWYKELLERRAIVGKFQGGEHSQGQDVDVAIINSVARHPEILNEYQFVVYDEIHHLAAEENVKQLELLKGKAVLGLTSTFERSDAREQILESGTTDMGLFAVKDRTKAIPVIFKLTLKEARAEGIIAPLEVTTKGVPLMDCGILPHAESCEYFIYEDISKRISKLWAELHPKNFGELNTMGWRGKQCIGLITKRKQLLATAWNKLPVTHDIIMSVHGAKVLVFSESIFSIEKLFAYLEQSGIKCGVYHSKNKKERDENFAKWEKGQIQVLLSVRALDEGINVPEVKVAIVIASGRANRQWTQRMGRILRLTGAQAKLYIVYCRDSIEKDFPDQVAKILSGD